MAYRKGAYFFLDKTFLEYIPKKNNTIPMDAFRTQPLGTVCIQDHLGTDTWRMHVRLTTEDGPYPYSGAAGWRHIMDATNIEGLDLPDEIKAQMLLIG